MADRTKFSAPRVGHPANTRPIRKSHFGGIATPQCRVWGQKYPAAGQIRENSLELTVDFSPRIAIRLCQNLGLSPIHIDESVIQSLPYNGPDGRFLLLSLYVYP